VLHRHELKARRCPPRRCTQSLRNPGFWFLVCNAATQLALQFVCLFVWCTQSADPYCASRSRLCDFVVFGLLCRHTASNPITAGTHTNGAQ